MASKRYAQVSRGCVACGSCIKVCPLSAIAIWRGVTALVDPERCVGCGKCAQECPGGFITLADREVGVMKKRWYDYLWIVSPIYLGLGFFNILFAWLGLIFFVTPLLIAIFGGSKAYCNRYCDRGQFLRLLGGRLKLSRNRPMPRWMGSAAFRYGFLIFFFIMFFQMLWTTWLVGAGAKDLGQFVKLFWTFRVPWQWAYHGGVAPWVAQFAFGFYSVMLTSTLLGLIVMALFKPRAWCVFCPMGTMTQLICRLKAGRPPVRISGCSGSCASCGGCGGKEEPHA